MVAVTYPMPPTDQGREWTKEVSWRERLRRRTGSGVQPHTTACEQMSSQYIQKTEGAIQQGDIYRDVDYVEDAYLDPGRPGYLRIDKLHFPYVVVLSQACDLKRDVQARTCTPPQPDKQVDSILVCPAYDVTLFVQGKHLQGSRDGLMETWQVQTKGRLSTRWATLVRNDNPRYHFLQADAQLGINDMVLDFKHFYTFPRERLYRIRPTSYVVSLKELFRERLSQRFADFLSRIGLPDPPKL